MRFSIEQRFLTDSSGKPLDGSPATAYHVVEAETLDAALSSFLGEQQASILGTIQRFAGAQAIATAQQQGTVFTFHVEPGTDAFRRRPRLAARSAASAERDAERR